MTKANGKQRKISKFTAKGGVGKSSILENIAAYLALMEYKVLFIECDMQRNVSKILPEPPEYNLNDVIIGRVSIQQAIYQARENFFILPADRNLDKAANHIVVNGRKAYDSLKRAVNELTEYDFILFDHSPSYSPITEAALRASDEILVPVELEPYAIDGLIEMFEKLQEELYDHELILTGIVPNKVDFSSTMTQQYLDQINEEFKDKVTPYIRIDKQIPRSQAWRKTIFEFNEHSKAAQDIIKVVAHIIKAGENNNG
jgi:ATPases involved in chromosome partitioning